MKQSVLERLQAESRLRHQGKSIEPIKIHVPKIREPKQENQKPEKPKGTIDPEQIRRTINELYYRNAVRKGIKKVEAKPQRKLGPEPEQPKEFTRPPAEYTNPQWHKIFNW